MAGALNFRDLGGVSASKKKLVRKGVLFRSDGLSRLTENDLKSVKSLITTQNEIIRYNLILETTFKVISLQKNKEIYSKDFSSQTAYSASKSVTGFATQTTKDSAKDRLAKDIANKILMDLLIVRGDLFN